MKRKRNRKKRICVCVCVCQTKVPILVFTVKHLCEEDKSAGSLIKLFSTKVQPAAQ